MTQRGLLIESGKEKYVVLGWNSSALSACKLEIYPNSKDFGSVAVGTCSNEAAFNIRNVGAGDAIIDIYLVGEDKGNFTITENGGSHTIPGGGPFGLTTKVKFCPLSEGPKKARLFIDSYGCDNVYADLYGNGGTPSPSPPSDEPEEKRWLAIGASWTDSKVLIARCPYTKTLNIAGNHNRNIFLDKWGFIWVRPESCNGDLHYYNLRGDEHGSIDCEKWGDSTNCFTLGPAIYRMDIFVPIAPRKIKVITVAKSGNFFYTDNTETYDIDVAPYDIYYDLSLIHI